MRARWRSSNRRDWRLRSEAEAEPRRPAAVEAAEVSAARPGVAYLVGAGPGDPGLITRRALALIAAADVVLYDRLIPAGALDGARTDAELVYVGKAPGSNAMEQEEIEKLMVERTR